MAQRLYVSNPHVSAAASIEDGDDPLTKMSSFFSFLAHSVDEEVVYWTEPYFGFSTGAMQTTAATPVFDNSKFKTLLGVVGVDVHLGMVEEKFGTSSAAVGRAMANLRIYVFLLLCLLVIWVSIAESLPTAPALPSRLSSMSASLT